MLMRTLGSGSSNHAADSGHVRPWWESLRVQGFLKLALFILLVVVYPFYIASQPSIEATPVSGGTYSVPDILKKVTQVVNIPLDDQVAVTQLVDLSTVYNQPFFRRALVDDVLLVYRKHGLAILYDPVSEKVINMTWSPELVEAVPVTAVSSPEQQPASAGP